MDLWIQYPAALCKHANPRLFNFSWLGEHYYAGLTVLPSCPWHAVLDAHQSEGDCTPLKRAEGQQLARHLHVTVSQGFGGPRSSSSFSCTCICITNYFFPLTDKGSFSHCDLTTMHPCAEDIEKQIKDNLWVQLSPVTSVKYLWHPLVAAATEHSDTTQQPDCGCSNVHKMQSNLRCCAAVKWLLQEKPCPYSVLAI
jgi:hypothetical protein